MSKPRKHGHFSEHPVFVLHAVDSYRHVLDTSGKCPIFLFDCLNYGHIWTRVTSFFSVTKEILTMTRVSKHY